MSEKFRNFYGRHKGKKLRPAQQRRMEALLPRIRIEGVEQGQVSLAENFGFDGPFWLEIGFGAGEHMAHIAAENPEIGIVGSEPYVNGVAAALRHIEEGKLDNVRLFDWDVRALFDALPSAVFSRAYLLYPDPWPKDRHAARRFASTENLEELARLLQTGSELRIASDIPEYIAHALEEIDKVDGFTRLDHPIETPWEGWFRTRYEAKAIREGRTPHYLRFVRD